MSLKVKYDGLKRFLLENRHVKQTVLKNTFWLGMSNIAARFIKAILIIYAARALGVAGYGVFSYAVTLSGFLAIFSDLGLGPILTREGAKHPEKMRIFLGTALFIKLALVIFTAILTIVVGPLISKIPETISLLPLAALLLAFDSFRDFTSSLSRFQEKMQIEATINAVTYSAITLLGLTALFIKPTPMNLMLGYTLGSGVGTIFSIWVFRTYFHRFWSFFDKTLVKEIFSSAWLFALMGLLGGIMISTDTIMLAWLKNANEVGLYSAAQRPIQILYVLPSLLAASIFPVLSKLVMQSKEQFRSVMEKSIKILLVLAIPMVVGGIILSQDITLLLFGKDYLPSAPMFSLLLFTIIVVFPGTIIGNAVFAYNAQKSFIGFLAVGALGNAFFNYLLIPSFGGVGASVATIIAQILANSLTWWKMKKINDFKIFSHLKKTVLAALVMGLAVIALKAAGVNVIANIAISFLIYASALYLLKEPLLDRNFILSIFR